jgi:peptidoglycan/LPS O-acetylase OafA/YrhL
LFPPLAALLLRDGRRARALLVLGGLCGLVLAWRITLWVMGAGTEYLTMATDARVDAILMGSLMALVCNPRLDRGPTPRLQVDAVVAGLGVLLLLASLVLRDEGFRLTLRYTLQGLAIAALIHVVVLHAHRGPLRWLSARPVVYLGSVSYTVYLAHHVILLGLAKHLPQWNGVARAGVAVLVTLGVAELMRRAVEAPVARLRARLHAPWPGRGEPPPATPAVETRLAGTP